MTEIFVFSNFYKIIPHIIKFCEVYFDFPYYPVFAMAWFLIFTVSFTNISFINSGFFLQSMFSYNISKVLVLHTHTINRSQIYTETEVAIQVFPQKSTPFLQSFFFF